MMKLFFALLLLGLSQISFAQEESGQKRNFKGGLIAGAVTSQISGDGLGGWDKFGLAAGAWVNVPFSDRASATMSMKYINKGSRTKRDTLRTYSARSDTSITLVIKREIEPLFRREAFTRVCATSNVATAAAECRSSGDWASG